MGGVERPARDLDLQLGRRRDGGARIRRRPRRDRALPLEHVHGDAAGGVEGGGRVEFVDCNRDDLCVSLDDFQAKAQKHKPKAAWLVHIGGHIAFEVEEIAAFCATRGSSSSRTARTRTAPAGTGEGRDVGRRRRVLALRDEDDLDGRGRRAGLAE